MSLYVRHKRNKADLPSKLYEMSWKWSVAFRYKTLLNKEKQKLPHLKWIGKEEAVECGLEMSDAFRATCLRVSYSHIKPSAILSPEHFLHKCTGGFVTLSSSHSETLGSTSADLFALHVVTVELSSQKKPPAPPNQTTKQVESNVCFPSKKKKKKIIKRFWIVGHLLGLACICSIFIDSST